jgi:hypothetical protein
MVEKTHDLYQKLTTKALLETQKKIKVLYDYEMLVGEGKKFYMNIETRQFVPITAGKVITRMTEETDEQGRHIVYTENQKILVPASDIITIGFN